MPHALPHTVGQIVEIVPSAVDEDPDRGVNPCALGIAACKVLIIAGPVVQNAQAIVIGRALGEIVREIRVVSTFVDKHADAARRGIYIFLRTHSLSEPLAKALGGLLGIAEIRLPASQLVIIVPFFIDQDTCSSGETEALSGVGADILVVSLPACQDPDAHQTRTLSIPARAESGVSVAVIEESQPEETRSLASCESYERVSAAEVQKETAAQKPSALREILPASITVIPSVVDHERDGHPGAAPSRVVQVQIVPSEVEDQRAIIPVDIWPRAPHDHLADWRHGFVEYVALL